VVEQYAAGAGISELQASSVIDTTAHADGFWAFVLALVWKPRMGLAIWISTSHLTNEHGRLNVSIQIGIEYVTIWTPCGVAKLRMALDG